MLQDQRKDKHNEERKEKHERTSWYIILINNVIGQVCLFVFSCFRKYLYKNILGTFVTPGGVAIPVHAYQQQTAPRLHPWVFLKVPQRHLVIFRQWWELRFFELEVSCQLGVWSSAGEWNSKPCLVGLLKENRSHHYSATSSDRKQELTARWSTWLTCEGIASFVR